MIKLSKKYQLWIDYGCEGWSLYELDTLEECIDYPKYGQDFTITKEVDISIKEKSNG